MHEKRLTTRLTEHWISLPRSEGKVAPEYKHFRAPQINDALPFCAKIRVQDPENPSPLCGFEEAGQKLQEAFGKDALVGKLLRPNAPIFPAARIIRNIPVIINGLQPIEDDGQFTNESGKLVKYRSILLPFVEYKANVEIVVIGFNWRVFG
jgi:hypothetical protein